MWVRLSDYFSEEPIPYHSIVCSIMVLFSRVKANVYSDRKKKNTRSIQTVSYMVCIPFNVYALQNDVYILITKTFWLLNHQSLRYRYCFLLLLSIHMCALTCVAGLSSQKLILLMLEQIERILWFPNENKQQHFMNFKHQEIWYLIRLWSKLDYLLFVVGKGLSKVLVVS